MIGKSILDRWPKPSLERGQAALLLALAALTLGAWVLTVDQARTMDMQMGVVVSGAADTAQPPDAAESMGSMSTMAMDMPASDPMGEMGEIAASGMSGAEWAWEALLAFLLAWSVMMAAMMFPAAAPMLLFFQRTASQRKSQGRAFVPTWVFAAGYLAVWSAVGAATWVLIRLTSDLAGRLGEPARETWAPLALGAVLAIAGLYQFTPLKSACLRQCQSPMGFVMTHWRDGRAGALRMGVAHGMYCLGCCWMLFAVLVAAGVMSLAWMLVLTLLVFAEKTLPLGTRAVHATGAAFLLLGILVAAGATNLPWSA
jgi:predicted metal-binding membrane protein